MNQMQATVNPTWSTAQHAQRMYTACAGCDPAVMGTMHTYKAGPLFYAAGEGALCTSPAGTRIIVDASLGALHSAGSTAQLLVTLSAC